MVTKRRQILTKYYGVLTIKSKFNDLLVVVPNSINLSPFWSFEHLISDLESSPTILLGDFKLIPNGENEFEFFAFSSLSCGSVVWMLFSEVSLFLDRLLFVKAKPLLFSSSLRFLFRPPFLFDEEDECQDFHSLGLNMARQSAWKPLLWLDYIKMYVRGSTKSGAHLPHYWDWTVHFSHFRYAVRHCV